MTSEKGLKMSPREILRTHSYPVLAAVSTLTLVIATLSVVESSQYLKEASQYLEEVSKSLKPISTWANNQNDCVERTFRIKGQDTSCLLYTSPSPRDATLSRMPSSA